MTKRTIGESHRQVEPYYWKACAGITARFPAAGDAVYYFPDGHCEQASSPPNLSAVCLREPFLFPCIVTSVRLLADRDTDEVYAVIHLVPSSPEAAPAAPDPKETEEVLGVAGPGVDWCAKVLTPSDANNGGGFSVPRHCADGLLPPLNRKKEPPLQILPFTDGHGNVWELRHIFRGTPRRHLLTTGWSKFVNSKRLIAGDSVVFVRNVEGGLSIGVRRAAGRRQPKSGRDFKYSKYCAGRAGKAVAMMEAVDDGGFSRRGRGRVAPEAVVKAVAAAEVGRSFEVVYYPGVGAGDFVVGRGRVDAAMGIQWEPGMRVRMAVEVEDSVKVGWRQGTLAGMKTREQYPWSWSPWRMLQVKWDDPDFLAPSVNPWQVELVPETPEIPQPIVKKLRARPPNAVLKELDQNIPFTTSRFNSPISGSVNPASMVYNSFPAGMQGARQNITGSSSLSSFRPYKIQFPNTEKVDEDMVPHMDHTSTEMCIRSPSSNDTSSPPSRDTVLCSVPKYSIQLFGTTIQMEQPMNGDASPSNSGSGTAADSPSTSTPCEEDQPCEAKGREASDAKARFT